MCGGYYSYDRLNECALTYDPDGPGVGEVVRDDLAELGEVPTVPLPATHVVVVQLLVQIIQQRWRQRKGEGETEMRQRKGEGETEMRQRKGEGETANLGKKGLQNQALTNCLHNHGIHFVRAKLELVAREAEE